MKSLVFSILMVLSINVLAHPFYVSIFTVNYDNSSKSLQFTIKVFSDDLELAIKDFGVNKFSLTNEDTNTYLEKYVGENLNCSTLKKAIDIKYLGFENESDVTYIYLEAIGVKPPKQLTFESNFLTKSFEDQSNIFHFSCGEIKESFALSKTQSKYILSID